MLYSWAAEWHTSAFWRTCWRKRTTSQSGRTFGSDRLMPLHWHSWLVISLHTDKEYFNRIAGYFWEWAMSCCSLCIAFLDSMCYNLRIWVDTSTIHVCSLHFFAPNDNNVSLSSSSELFHWVWGLWHLATYVWPQSSWYLKLPIGR